MCDVAGWLSLETAGAGTKTCVATRSSAALAAQTATTAVAERGAMLNVRVARHQDKSNQDYGSHTPPECQSHVLCISWNSGNDTMAMCVILLGWHWQTQQAHSSD
eukprot:TRINITY_DN2379_c4_g1_i2.p2 TRINITY_DN2379_c4_g1~~TRINITY_DN2379_c4_g1_i2.p2  ORF type:complete len:105 (+),score=8.34 TRINITY_DN2379_c4_g1_i2:158-472(+)